VRGPCSDQLADHLIQRQGPENQEYDPAVPPPTPGRWSKHVLKAKRRVAAHPQVWDRNRIVANVRACPGRHDYLPLPELDCLWDTAEKDGSDGLYTHEVAALVA